ncbi:TetR/AcrR family transcriptional regulator [Mycobacterium sp. 663a-19]|uniref:TetR/AcrR family transcriptional regulator n=1 Tax=Mycobacterium sp. 663a-19 TaxID=2986148 RepID=UPI002D1F975A|nr:TetR/AcrR family transcriptional regulator [Mycobacterium sp. 663a-19]MEB3984091.1 TetR/AcrR family transcriptional regulator [Mycobacterium sp. 663a-19]
MRRRPKDRKAQIARASADAFSAQGYHAVSMEDIAARVGISPAALYRHSPSKYDLFRDAVLALGRQLVEATAFADDAAEGDPAELLGALVTALVDTAIANRTAGGLYRWEGRYLQGADRTALKDQLRLTNRRLRRPLAVLRPTLKPPQLSTLSAAALAVIGSITDHTAPLAVGEIRDAVSRMAADVLAADLPAGRARAPAAPRPAVTASAGTYEFVLHESLHLFYERGFRDTSMDDIAAAVGTQPSGLYRYFPGKVDILTALYRRAADRLSGDVAKVVARTADPGRALSALLDAYVARSFARPEVAYIYYTERHNLPAEEMLMLDAIQQSSVDAWARLAAAARPGLSVGRARYAVHAAYAVIVDLGRVVRHDNNTAHARSTARRLAETILLGRPAGKERGR